MTVVLAIGIRNDARALGPPASLSIRTTWNPISTDIAGVVALSTESKVAAVACHGFCDGGGAWSPDKLQHCGKNDTTEAMAEREERMANNGQVRDRGCGRTAETLLQCRCK